MFPNHTGEAFYFNFASCRIVSKHLMQLLRKALIKNYVGFTQYKANMKGRIRRNFDYLNFLVNIGKFRAMVEYASRRAAKNVRADV